MQLTRGDERRRLVLPLARRPHDLLHEHATTEGRRPLLDRASMARTARRCRAGTFSRHRRRRRIAAASSTGRAPQGGGRGGRGGGGGDTGNGEIWKLTLQNQRTERVHFTFPVRVDAREWKQLFEEAWRVMKYRFYDPKMHGKDWARSRRSYKPLLKYVGTNEDVYDLANEMIGELNASHTGVSGPAEPAASTRAYQTRYPRLRARAGERPIRDQPHLPRRSGRQGVARPERRATTCSPSTAQEIKAGDNYWKTLSETLNEYVPVQVAKRRERRGREACASARSRARSTTSSTRSGSRRIASSSTRRSNGEIAYVHIRSMDQPSLERFRNEIDQFWNKKGIVVDIRYNGGGNIDQELIDILERRPYQYWNSRWGSRAWGRRPRQAIAGPKVMLINWRSGSDSEVTPQGFRELGLGRIVGNPTAAAVIATGSYALINGGSIRTPGSLVITYDPTKPNNYGINLENFGVQPDVVVEEHARWIELRRFDRELKAAVDEAMKMMKEGKWQYTTSDGQGSR